MILPQSKSFTALKTRLECINIAPFQLELEGGPSEAEVVADLKESLELFDASLAQVEKQCADRPGQPQIAKLPTEL